MSEPAAPEGLVVRGLRAGYGETDVLPGIDLDVPAGTLAAVLGPSGCGKSTVLRVLAGLLPARAGAIRLAGRDLEGVGRPVAPEHRRVGLVPQDAALFSHLDVAGNVGFGLSGTGRSLRAGREARRARTARVAELLELVELSAMAHRMPHELSGGQRHRVALARALAPDPDLLLLDEPFSALDASLRIEVRDQVVALVRAAGTTTVLVTHDQDEALSVADLVAVMSSGRIRQVAAPQQVYDDPVSRWVGEFVGDAVVLPGRWSAGTVHCALGAIPADGVGLVVDAPNCTPGVAADQSVDVLLRPEHLVLDTSDTDDVDAVPGTIRTRSFQGHDSLLVVDLGRGDDEHGGADGGAGPTGVVRVRVPGTLAVAPGDAVRLRVVGRARAYRPT